MLFRPRRLVTVYGGPSLKLICNKNHELLRFCGPIERNSLLKLIEESKGKPGVALITDGLFGSRLAITPNECKEYIRRGGLLFGSSSIGALRAADCYNIGMVGVGDVFMGYHLGYYRSESDVAMLYDQKNYNELTYSLIHLDYVLHNITSEGLISSVEYRLLAKELRKIKWYERTEDKILSCLAPNNQLSSKFMMMLQDDNLNPKKKDALLAFNHIYKYYLKMKMKDEKS